MRRSRSVRNGIGIVGLVAAIALAAPATAVGAPGSPACGSWTVVPSPDAGSNGSTFSGVSAVSRSAAWAVGSSYTGSTYRTLIERWDGSSWSLQIGRAHV